ncbi:MAG: hypothetical protein IKD73_07935, partial [Selenomonadaceae bacterium]|nr:hypothetical protein [Selenomonadaceae bacterium]
PYESIIAIGEDAVTITHSENILTLDEAGDYERLLDENIRVIGTKAITRNGRIQGKVTEVFIGDGGKIERCEITAPDGSVNEVGSEQISIFGKQVTVVDVDEEKKNSLTEKPAFEPVQESWTPAVEEPPIIQHELPPPEVNTTSPEEQAVLEEIMTPEPVVEEVAEPVVEEVAEPVVEEVAEPVVEEVAEPVVEEVAEPIVEEVAEPVVEEVAEPVVEDKPSEEDKKIAAMTQQAEDLKAALQKARASQQGTSSEQQAPMLSQRKQVEKAVDERRRRVLLGKHATKTITTDSGTLVVEVGAEVTEEVLQRARLSNKFIELSMNVK